MSATLTAISTITALESLIINTMIAKQKINDLLLTAQAEGRDISNDEWANLLNDANIAEARLKAMLENQ